MGEIVSPKEVAAQEQFAEFQHLCDQMMFWINYKEVIVWPEDLKTEHDSQVILKQKYVKFNEEVAAQEGHFNDVMKLADLLIEGNHPEDIVIRRRREELKQSWQRMRKLALKRQMLGQEELASTQPIEVVQPDEAQKLPSIQSVATEAKLLRGLLEDFLRLEQFEKDCHPTKTWINETIGMMSDDDHLSPTNLNAKMENHKKLEEDVMSRKNRVEVLVKIQAHLTDVLKLWEVLLAATELKSIHMSQAWQLEKFNHGIDNMTAWLAEVEATLSSQEFGSDLASVELLTKEHTLLERDIKTHKDIIDIIVTAAQQFSECGHFDLKSILSKKEAVVKRFDGLTPLLAERQRKLGDSLKAYQLFHEIEVEEDWIAKKHEVIAGRGKDIDTVRALIKETQAILQAMQVHDPDVQRVIQAGQKLAKGHHLAEEINGRIQKLSEHWANLKERAFERKQSNQLVLLFLFQIKD